MSPTPSIRPSATYDFIEMSDAQLAHEKELYGGLADAVRRLAQASVRTTVDEEMIRKATAAVDVLAEQLEESQNEGSFAVSITTSGPGLVHGGVIALILDQIFGEAAAAGGSPGMTGTLTLRYSQGTPLGDCSAEAWVDRREGVKTFVKGAMRNADGEDTVSAEGVFILPRWARQDQDGGAPAPKAFE